MSEQKSIAGTPAEEDMVRPFGITYLPVPASPYGEDIVKLTVPGGPAGDGLLRIARTELTIPQFYELREAVNDLYDYIRQEQSTD